MSEVDVELEEVEAAIAGFGAELDPHPTADRWSPDDVTAASVAKVDEWNLAFPPRFLTLDFEADPQGIRALDDGLHRDTTTAHRDPDPSLVLDVLDSSLVA